MNFKEEILRLKKEKNAVILCHNYINRDVQEVADYLGDSYGLSVKAKETEADIIVFAGVRFMAETAKILNPSKKVILSNIEAGCPMADMVNAQDIINEKKKTDDDLYVATYVNSSAEVKAESDVCLTSGNALKVIKNIPSSVKNILFVPDKNLGRYVEKISGRSLILWDGYCCVHQDLKPEQIDKIRAKDSNALIIVHPECRLDVIEKADMALSTAGMAKFVRENQDKNIYLGTEPGIVARMIAEGYDVRPVDENMICKNMKKTTLQDIYYDLLEERNQIVLPAELMNKARNSLEKMIEFTELDKQI
ncbi:MAG: quinolinate synthase [Candidatus Muiribacterium halophilum]|uniref:Quinolinate synthase n=1 Tax=Muiribacterium halophilum TaxID=2053465 RepID=A0A2N5ZJ90_MUIH1|nr:MAG: quinolinate synthase [Candidatus Muirbacterium halophilum]